MSTTVLLPGGFKPPHGKHLQLARNYASLKDVDKVVVLIGPKERDGISREDSVAIWKMLTINDPKIEIVKTDNNSPLQSAYGYVESIRQGDFILAAGTKDNDYQRSKDFVKTFSPDSEPRSKYYIDGVTARELPASQISKVLQPIYYKGRKDGNTDELSATTLRQDLSNRDYESFKTNYPNVKDDKTLKAIYNFLVDKVKIEDKPVKTKKKSTKKDLNESRHISDILEERAYNRLILLELLSEKNIVEGGNVFVTLDGKPATTRIKKADVLPTVKWLEKITGLKLTNSLLGTTGKKEDSGDIDIAIDQEEISKEELISRLEKAGYKAQQKKTKQNPNPPKDYSVSKSGVSVHFKTPILGKDSNGYVQTDFMFGDPNWMKFAQSAPVNSDYKGVHRAMLIMSIATAQGYRFSTSAGLQNRETGEIITDPDKIAEIILGPGKKEKDFDSVESIINAIKDRKDYEDLVKDAKTGGKYEFEKYGATFPQEDITIKEIIKLIVKSKLLKEGTMRGKSGIDHPEDLVYTEEGLEAAKKVLELFKKIEKDKSLVASKWDGSPAVAFGVDNSGNFIFGDKHMFNPDYENYKNNPVPQEKQDVAKQYAEAKPNSPEKLDKIYSDRLKRAIDKGNNSGKPMTPDQISSYKNMSSNMKNAYNIVKDAWPDGLKGIFTGDMMYSKTPPVVDGKYVFQPNTVKYEVPVDSEIGKKMKGTEVGIVLHTYRDANGKKIPQLNDISSYKFKPGKKLMVYSPGIPNQEIKIDNSLLSAANNAINQAKDADKLLKKIPGSLLYTYTNSMVKNMNDLSAESFIKDLESQNKRKSTIDAAIEHKDDLDKIFNVVKAINNLKNSVIEELDKQNLGLPASIDGVPGGEGYVITDKDNGLGQVKLVNRSGFTAANRARQR